MPEAQAVIKDDKCREVLPKFYDQTSNGEFEDMDQSRQMEVMESFCNTTCGTKYTEYLQGAGFEGRDCARQRLITHRRRRHHDNDEEEEEGVDQDQGEENGTSRRRHRGRGNDDEEDEDDDWNLGDVVDINWGGSGSRYHPSNVYPGLMLGCVKDSSDGQFCALKKGSLEDRECDFYKVLLAGTYSMLLGS